MLIGWLLDCNWIQNSDNRSDAAATVGSRVAIRCNNKTHPLPSIVLDAPTLAGGEEHDEPLVPRFSGKSEYHSRLLLL